MVKGLNCFSVIFLFYVNQSQCSGVYVRRSVSLLMGLNHDAQCSGG